MQWWGESGVPSTAKIKLHFQKDNDHNTNHWLKQIGNYHTFTNKIADNKIIHEALNKQIVISSCNKHSRTIKLKNELLIERTTSEKSSKHLALTITTIDSQLRRDSNILFLRQRHYSHKIRCGATNRGTKYYHFNTQSQEISKPRKIHLKHH